MREEINRIEEDETEKKFKGTVYKSEKVLQKT